MSRPSYIYLIRHGESIGNVRKKAYNVIPDWKISLTDKGKKQASDMADKLFKMIGHTSVMLYCSPWLRTRQTAEALKKKFNSYKYHEDPRLREQEWGNFREDHLALKIEKERYKFGTFFYRMPYGESGADVYDRVSTFFETMYRDFKEEYFPRIAVIVSHGLTIKVLLMRFFHWTVEEFESYKTPGNCAIIEMRHNYETDKYELTTALRKRPG